MFLTLNSFCCQLQVCLFGVCQNLLSFIIKLWEDTITSSKNNICICRVFSFLFELINAAGITHMHIHMHTHSANAHTHKYTHIYISWMSSKCWRFILSLKQAPRGLEGKQPARRRHRSDQQVCAWPRANRGCVKFSLALAHLSSPPLSH